MDRRFLEHVLNSDIAGERLQVTAYNLLNVQGYKPTDEELAELLVAKVCGGFDSDDVCS